MQLACFKMDGWMQKQLPCQCVPDPNQPTFLVLQCEELICSMVCIKLQCANVHGELMTAMS